MAVTDAKPEGLKSRVEALPTFTQHVFAGVDDHAGRNIVTVSMEDVLRLLADDADVCDEVRNIVRGFTYQSINGIICVPPSDECGLPQWDAPPNRTWCIDCKALWTRLRKLAVTRANPRTLRPLADPTKAVDAHLGAVE